MKTILAIIACAFVFAGCTAKTGVSVGHEGHQHGVAVKGSTERGVSGGVKAY